MKAKIKKQTINLMLLILLPLTLTTLIINPNNTIENKNLTNQNKTIENYTIEEIKVGPADSSVNSGGVIINNGINDVLYMWGDNTYGQLGDGTTITKNEPQAIDIDGSGSAYDEGQLSNLTLDRNDSAIVKNSTTSNDSLYIWGDNTYGQGGNNIASSELILSPKRVETGTANYQIKEVAFGRDNINVVINNLDNSKDEVYSWGFNNYSLGLGTIDDVYQPTLVNIPFEYETITNIGNYELTTYISTVTSDGQSQLIGWGKGNFADGTSNHITPKQISLAATGVEGEITDISGDLSTFGIVINDGQNDHIFTAGNNEFGELGVGDTEDRSVFTEVLPNQELASNSVDLSLELDFAGSALIDNQLYTWGNNHGQRLGLSSGSIILVPTKVETSSTEGTITQLSTGSDNILFLTDDGINQRMYYVNQTEMYLTIIQSANPEITSDGVIVNNVTPSSAKIDYQFKMNGAIPSKIELKSSDNSSVIETVNNPEVINDTISGSFELTNLNETTNYNYNLVVTFNRPFDAISVTESLPISLITTESIEPFTQITFLKNTKTTATFKVNSNLGVAPNGDPWIVDNYRVFDGTDEFASEDIVNNQDGTFSLINLQEETVYSGIMIEITYRDSDNNLNPNLQKTVISDFSTTINVQKYFIFGGIIIITLIIIIIAGVFVFLK